MAGMVCASRSADRSVLLRWREIVMRSGISEETCYCAGTLMVALLLAAMPTIIRLAPLFMAAPRL